MGLSANVGTRILAIAFVAASANALAVDRNTCSQARENYLDIQVRETRRCCNAGYSRSQAEETADGAVEEANGFSDIDDLKEEIASVGKRIDKLQNARGNNGMLAHFVMYECLYRERLRELRRSR